MTVVAVLALLIALGALALAVSTSQQLKAQPAAPATTEDDVPPDVHALREEVAALRLDVSGMLRHLAVVRYDAFPDVGGRLSWSMSLLDDNADGVVLTAIHGRNDSRTYAKGIRAGKCAQQLSPEEEQAVERARP